MKAPPRWFPALECVLVASLLAWLAASAALLDIEYFDGINTIHNARAILGVEGYTYVEIRAPFLALVLIPAELVRLGLGLGLMEWWPYHATMALMHGAYAIAVYLLLRRHFGPGWPVLVAYAAAIPTYVFFSIGPYISHDLFPGLLMLGMVLLAHRVVTEPSRLAWAGLIALGAIGPMIKHPLGLMWVVILMATAALWAAGRWPRGPDTFRTWRMLFAGAVASAQLFWLVMGWSLGFSGGEIADVPLVARPYFQLVGYVGGPGSPPTVYLRNLGAYGAPLVVLVPIGVIRCLRGSDRVAQLAALSWVLFVAIQFGVFHAEVRYMAPLMPLSAFLCVPALQWLGRFRATWGVVGLVLALECLPFAPYPRLGAAARITQPFYRSWELRPLVEALIATDRERLMVADSETLLLGCGPDHRNHLPLDRFHELFHLGWKHVYATLDRGPENFVQAPRPLQDLWRWEPGSVVVGATAPYLVHDEVSPRRQWPLYRFERAEYVGTIDEISLAQLTDLEVLPQGDGVVLRSAQLSAALRDAWAPQGPGAKPLEPAGADSWRVAGLRVEDARGASIRLVRTQFVHKHDPPADL